MTICFEHGLTLLKPQVWYSLDWCTSVLHKTVETGYKRPLVCLPWATAGLGVTVTGGNGDLHDSLESTSPDTHRQEG